MRLFCIIGATLACGTGACATVVAAVLEGRAGRVSVGIYLLVVIEWLVFIKAT